MLATDVIEPAQTSWAFPIVFARKYGKFRFCVNYQKLNTGKIQESYSILRTDQCIDSPGDAMILSSLDTNSRNWQIEIAENDRYRTAGASHIGSLCLSETPLLAKNDPETFQHVIDVLL